MKRAIGVFLSLDLGFNGTVELGDAYLKGTGRIQGGASGAMAVILINQLDIYLV